MDYTELTDDELRRKALELMGFSVKEVVLPGTYPQYVFVLLKEKKHFCRGNFATEDRAWQQAPDPLTDANVYMGLVDEIGDVITMSRIGVNWYVEYYAYQPNRAYSPSIGRAICEVYCQVKEQK